MANHQGSANQNLKEKSPHPCLEDHYQKESNNCCERCKQKGTHIHCWWEHKLVQPPWKMV